MEQVTEQSGTWASEAPDPTTENLDLLPVEEQVRRVLAGDATVVPAVVRAADAIARVVEAVAARLGEGGRLVYVGAGSAGRTAALDAAEVGPTFGVDARLVTAVVAGGLGVLTDAKEGLEDDAEAGAHNLAAAGVTDADVVIAVSASGRTPYTLAAARRARGAGALTVALVSDAASPLAVACHEAIVVVTGPEAVAGSTRLRAATAQKIALNTISTLVMVRLGHTYGNRMVGVRPDNDKLRARARRALADIAGVDEEAAAEALDASGDARTALVVLLTGADPRDAAAALIDRGGRVRDAVRDLGR